MHYVGRWSARLLALLGIELTQHGRVADGPLLLVGNHVSWLDILAINAVRPVRFVSKADVRAWPLLGWMVGCAGTLFIERERKRDALRVVHQIAAALQQRQIVAVFPEGTTGDGHALLPFHANLLQAAIATGAPVQPVALRYADRAAPVSAAAAYVGDMSLAQSIWRIVNADGLRVDVALLAPLPSAAAERRALAETLRARIAAALGPPP